MRSRRGPCTGPVSSRCSCPPPLTASPGRPTCTPGGSEAEEHRAGFVEELRREGLDVKDAKLGDADPLAAVCDETHFAEYDEVIVSTLPLKVSKWLHLDLPSKARAATGLPVQHVVASEAKAVAR